MEHSVSTGAILWRRLDVAGHDACRLLPRRVGWRLSGAASFQHEGTPASLTYEVDCDKEWRTREGVVRGWVGSHPVDSRIVRRPDGTWTLNGQHIPGLAGCVDLDLGFTPATNLFQLRRIALQIGEAAEVPVAWLDLPPDTLDELHQRYERRTTAEYWYEAPRFDYFATLRVNAVGFVERYPDLWVKER